jgi:putative oxidoreductase
MKKSAIISIISALLVLLFLYTSVHKFINFKGFVHDLNNQPFPNWLTPFLSWTLPTAEIVISLALIVDRTRRIGLYASAVLMLAFTLYTAAVLLGLFHRMPCSCGGVIRNLTWEQHLVFNIFFLLLPILGIVLLRKTLEADKKEASNAINTA